MSRWSRRPMAFVQTKVRNNTSFLEDLELTEFTDDKAPLNYRLYYVVAHGDKISNGHYIAAIRCHDDEGFPTISDTYIEAKEDGSWESLRYRSFKQGSFEPMLLFYLKV